jgi:hypothetical protein
MRHSFPPHDLLLIADLSSTLAQDIYESNSLNIELDSWNGENIFDIKKQSQNHLDGDTNHPQEQ